MTIRSDKQSIRASIRGSVRGSIRASSIRTIAAPDPETSTISNGKTPAAAYAAQTTMVQSPVSALFAHSTGSEDVVLRSSDGYDFYVHRFILQLGSPTLSSMLPSKSKMRSEDGDEPPVLLLHEPACILDVLLTLLYPVEPPTWTSLDGFGPVMDAALRYNMQGPIETLRTALISPRRVDDQILPSFADIDPLRVFAIARQNGLEPEAQLAGAATRGISLRNSQMSVEVDNMPTKFYRELISLRDERGHWRETIRLFKNKGVTLKGTSGLSRVGSSRSMVAPSFLGRARG